MGNDKPPSNTSPTAEPCDEHVDPADVPVEDESDDAVVAEGTGRPWRAAACLKALRDQVDQAFPARDPGSDGTIGDRRHKSRKSDHNAWITDGSHDVVSAMDITHDPRSGCDAGKIVAALHASRDKRIKYLIWNRRIANASAIGTVPAWTWRSYTGPNPHNHHFHLSVKPDKALYDDTSPWTIQQFAEAVAMGPADIDQEVLIALSALVQSLDVQAPALPQLVAVREALDQLFANLAHDANDRDDDAGASIEPESADRFQELKPRYEQLFATANVREEHRSIVAWHLRMLRKGRARYAEVEAATGTPWWFVGIVHGLEAGFNFSGHLHNGDPLGARTVQVPKGRPLVWNPPNDWLTSAIDALSLKRDAHPGDWSLARTLYRFEGYNGFGYYAKGIHSPYLWSFTNHYSRGKFVRDHRYDPNFVSKQCGAATMLLALVKAGEVTVAP